MKQASGKGNLRQLARKINRSPLALSYSCNAVPRGAGT